MDTRVTYGIGQLASGDHPEAPPLLVVVDRLNDRNFGLARRCVCIHRWLDVLHRESL